MARLLAQRADAMIGGKDAVLIIDDTALRKQGTRSIGGAHQYCGEVRTLANCQCLVSLTSARGEVPIPLALPLYLPTEWTDDPERCDTAGIPPDAPVHQTKIALALREIDWVRAADVRFGLVTADGEEGAQHEHMPGEIVWLVREQQPDDRRCYYFTNHHARWSLTKLVAAIRSRWACEQA